MARFVTVVGPAKHRCRRRPANATLMRDNMSHLSSSTQRRPAAARQRNGARADARGNRERILDAAGRLMDQSPTATLADVAAAAGISRSTIYRHFSGRGEL